MAAFLPFQTVSDLFQTSLGRPTNFHTIGGSADKAAFLQFRRFQTCGTSTNFDTNVGSSDSCFPTVSDGFKPVLDSLGCHKFLHKCRISGYSCFPTVSDGFRPVSDLFGTSANFHTNVGSADIAAFLRFQSFRPVSDLFGTSTNFHTNVGSADIAAFLRFQTVSDLFQTSLGCPQISIQM